MAQPKMNYWLKREKQKLKKYESDTDKLESELKRYYNKAYEQIKKEIESLFGKYAKNNKLDPVQAHKLLNGKEYRKWRMDLKDYVEEIKASADTQLLLELNTLSTRSQISVLDEKLYQVDKYINGLYETSYNRNTKFFKTTLVDSYYTQIYDIHKYVGLGSSFSLIDDDLVKEVLAYKWSGANYSERIWNNRSKLKFVVRESITKMVGQGFGVNEIAREVKHRMNVDFSNARRLIQSEHAYFVESGNKLAYEELGVEKYQILATLDSRTSSTCRGLDGQVFKLSEAMVGINYPPL